ncbi:hypothetical protein EVAR_82967_1 [Eumeta japonica]|uniref:Uncharacterized protein n=1 Tax=Eumeta variegata TaxID=151549 RepID=A0A4C1VRK9_EUMVA|nr:hypothetical protein EVAR_82967_1 [Eumeta japonica]
MWYDIASVTPLPPRNRKVRPKRLLASLAANTKAVTCIFDARYIRLGLTSVGAVSGSGIAIESEPESGVEI